MDPGFARGSANHRLGCANLLFDKIFAENCIKMKEFRSKGRDPGILHESISGIFTVSTNVRIYYLPQRSCGQGNIFAPVCHPVHRGRGGGGIPQGTEAEPPLDQTHHPSPRADTPRPDTPQSRPPKSRPPRPDTPSGPDPPGSRLRHTVYERPVRILLECILVLMIQKQPASVKKKFRVHFPDKK